MAVNISEQQRSRKEPLRIASLTSYRKSGPTRLIIKKKKAKDIGSNVRSGPRA